ncbi:MAG: hypothetical protein ACI80V_003592 [Rhodothermales bacterium]|jgi:hypothetical protein
MKNAKLYTFLVFSFLLLGCANAPLETLTQANLSFDEAVEAEGNLYMTEIFQAASDSLAAAQVEIEFQAARTAFGRDYARAEAQLAFAIQMSDSVTAGVPAAKEAIASANEALFQEAEIAVAQALGMMDQAPRGKDGVMALASIREDMDLTTASVQAARAAQAEGRILEARDRAQSALNRANEIIGELDAAIQAVRPRPRA